MSKTPSAMLPLGTQAPDFSLINVINGEMTSLSANADQMATVIMFICNHCPYVKHVQPELSHLANDYSNKNIRFIAINANDTSQYPDDSPENMKTIALEQRYPFPYLFDETQEVAKAYQAKCTPDFFVFDKNLKLVYRGQFDESRLGNNIKVNGNSIRIAMDCLLANKPVPIEQKPSLGCNIKWKD